MNVMAFKAWLKAGDTPLARRLYALAKTARASSFPVIPPVHRPLYAAHRAALTAVANLTRILWLTPLFQSRLTKPARRLFLYGGMPLVTGPLKITIGDDSRISGQTTFSGRAASRETPELVIGRNVGVGWQTTIAVGRKVILGDNVRIAGRAFLAGYPGHPVDAADRAAGRPDTEDQIGDIVIGRDAWLATNVTVVAGVTIGEGAIIAAGSVVTRDIPPYTLAAGAPARPIRDLGSPTRHAA